MYFSISGKTKRYFECDSRFTDEEWLIRIHFFVLNAETIKQIRNSDPNRSLSKVVDPKKSFKEPNCYQKKLKSPQIYYVSSTVHPNFLRNDFLCQVQRWIRMQYKFLLYISHCYSIRSNVKKMGHLQFYLSVFLGIHSCEGFLK